MNFRHLGLLFAVLPSARVLHVVRDGRASCLSCYFQLFQHRDTAFSYDLENLAEFYAGYRRMTAHWESEYPERIMRVNTEELVGSSRSVLADVLQFLDVDWDEAVPGTGARDAVVRSASVWQARQPLHGGSMDRWRNYAELAPEFFARLADIDRQYG